MVGGVLLVRGVLEILREVLTQHVPVQVVLGTAAVTAASSACCRERASSPCLSWTHVMRHALPAAAAAHIAAGKVLCVCVGTAVAVA